ncbi:hypothetical protein BO86DRAFT_40702 [Aspergillus japonicus CBS 114.51]|uniref:Uncharacterized protein n=1 Tax=Aspergillus japonicus CBS 114.51 TaxID=1448312 RepID=A0A8T8X662_ASPJA|nr:hypothetical protein BO86DRAFT_40702 [Aspergillus japonicus CBS 114.51]RAH83515.1 hypothetical protein BO86DRAFT_40702 [Aspergillus japonicus CBS 114.51]
MCKAKLLTVWANARKENKGMARTVKGLQAREKREERRRRGGGRRKRGGREGIMQMEKEKEEEEEEEEGGKTDRWRLPAVQSVYSMVHRERGFSMGEYMYQCTGFYTAVQQATHKRQESAPKQQCPQTLKF